MTDMAYPGLLGILSPFTMADGTCYGLFTFNRGYIHIAYFVSFGSGRICFFVNGFISDFPAACFKRGRQTIAPANDTFFKNLLYAAAMTIRAQGTFFLFCIRCFCERLFSVFFIVSPLNFRVIELLF